MLPERPGRNWETGPDSAASRAQEGPSRRFESDPPGPGANILASEPTYSVSNPSITSGMPTEMNLCTRRRLRSKCPRRPSIGTGRAGGRLRPHLAPGAEAAAAQETSTITVRPRDFVRRIRLTGLTEATQSYVVSTPLLAGATRGSLVLTKLAASGHGGQDRRPAGAVRQPGAGQDGPRQEGRVRGAASANQAEACRTGFGPSQRRQRTGAGAKRRQEIRARDPQERDAVARAGGEEQPGPRGSQVEGRHARRGVRS